ncbi:MAG: RNA polymerase sigma factor [Planctomycetota bacterium]|jgi:RNA polymerase sigma-70 factor (ECF subfamily)
MTNRAISYSLIWDFVIPTSIDQSQRWVLSAMQRHGQELVSMLWRILGNEQDVCDAYQDTFLKLAHYQQGQKPQHIKAYIFRTATNTAISILRHKIAERKILSIVTPIKNESSAVEEIDFKNLQQTLRLNIAQLPEYLRNVITLHDLAELSYAQIAKILGISAATARVYRCKAIQLLAVWMNKDKEKGKP